MLLLKVEKHAGSPLLLDTVISKYTFQSLELLARNAFMSVSHTS